MTTATFDYQRFVARLIVDTEFFESFLADRGRVIERFGFAHPDRARLGRLDAGELRMFRSVVESTREINFALVFDEIRSRMPDQAWAGLVDRFQRQVVVRDSGDSADMTAFCDWLAVEYPGSRGTALARYGLLLQLMGATPVHHGPAGTVQVAPRTHVTTLPFEIDEIFAATPENLWTIGAGSAQSWSYALQGSAQDDDVSILEVTHRAAALLAFLAKPRTAAQVRAVLPPSGTDDDALVAELIGAGLVVEN